MAASPIVSLSLVTGMAFGITVSPEVRFTCTTGMSVSSAGTASITPVINFTLTTGMAVNMPTLRKVAVAFNLTTGMQMLAQPVVATTTGIRATLQNVLSLFGAGCCSEPDPCWLAEAVRCVNEGLQQFFLSARVREFLINPKERRYSFTVAGQGAHKFFSLDGVDLPDRRATDSGLTTTATFHHVSRVTFTNATTGKTHHLTPVQSNSQAAAYAGLSNIGPGSTMMEWLDGSSGNVPLYYEVFRDPASGNRAKIRGYPFTTQGEEVVKFVTVSYFNAAAPVTVLDYRNGAGFDIAQSYIELYLMPLCRYAALSSQYFDSANQPLAASIKERYAEVLGFLELGDIQSP